MIYVEVVNLRMAPPVNMIASGPGEKSTFGLGNPNPIELGYKVSAILGDCKPVLKQNYGQMQS